MIRSGGFSETGYDRGRIIRLPDIQCNIRLSSLVTMDPAKNRIVHLPDIRFDSSVHFGLIPLSRADFYIRISLRYMMDDKEMFSSW